MQEATWFSNRTYAYASVTSKISTISVYEVAITRDFVHQSEWRQHVALLLVCQEFDYKRSYHDC